jgi:hypothetical protein
MTKRAGWAWAGGIAVTAPAGLFLVIVHPLRDLAR